MFRRFALFLILFAGFSTVSYTQSISEAGALFLSIPPGSRANAMGSAHTAVADDFYALYFSITRLQKGSIGVFHHDFAGIVGLPITFTGAVYTTRYGSFGFAFNNIDIDTESPFGGKLNSYERAFQLTYAKQVSAHVAIGSTIKLVQEKFDQPTGIPDASANAWAFDIGILVQNIFPHLTYSRRNDAFPQQFRKFDRQSSQGLSFGLALLNTGPDGFTFIDDGQQDPLPQILRLGAAFYAVDTDEVSLLLALDLDKFLVDRDKGFVESWFTTWDTGFDNLHFGAEINVYHVFAFRFGRDESLNFGLDNESIGDWTYGFGLGPEWARLNIVRRSFPVAASHEKWVVDFSVSY